MSVIIVEISYLTEDTSCFVFVEQTHNDASVLSLNKANMFSYRLLIVLCLSTSLKYETTKMLAHV